VRRRLATAWLLCLVLASAGPLNAGSEPESRVEQGRQLAMARNKGNCLACHAFDDGELPGNIGPPLIAMQLRFPDPEALRAQIWDPTERNPNTIMPPFGRHRILSEEEIDLIVEYIRTL
jgi:sulfur-oxidizing protein SoxX